MPLDLQLHKPEILGRLINRSWDYYDCWIWEGADNRVGYGTISFHGERWYTHRLAYATFRGPIPAGLVIDHLCRNTFCWRPTHLEAVTTKENILRGLTAQKTHCNQGHEFTPANTLRTTAGHRRCRECRNANERRRRARLFGIGIGA